jgi:hypothetical protein
MSVSTPKLGAAARRALTVLSGLPDGGTVSLLLAKGVKLRLIARLVEGGLVKKTNMSASARPIDATKIQITDAGRMALESD